MFKFHFKLIYEFQNKHDAFLGEDHVFARKEIEANFIRPTYFEEVKVLSKAQQNANRIMKKSKSFSFLSGQIFTSQHGQISLNGR